MSKLIMVVDDSELIRKYVTLALRSAGFQVIGACDGMEAVERLIDAKADLVITDLNMPNMDGYALVRALREDAQYREVPIIILSSLSDEVSIQEGLSIGADSYLVKPFDEKRVQFEVAKYLN